MPLLIVTTKTSVRQARKRHALNYHVVLRCFALGRLTISLSLSLLHPAALGAAPMAVAGATAMATSAATAGTTRSLRRRGRSNSPLASSAGTRMSGDVPAGRRDFLKVSSCLLSGVLSGDSKTYQYADFNIDRVVGGW